MSTIKLTFNCGEAMEKGVAELYGGLLEMIERSARRAGAQASSNRAISHRKGWKGDLA
jgi:hypothetical protein